MASACPERIPRVRLVVYSNFFTKTVSHQTRNRHSRNHHLRNCKWGTIKIGTNSKETLFIWGTNHWGNFSNREPLDQELSDEERFWKQEPQTWLHNLVIPTSQKVTWLHQLVIPCPHNLLPGCQNFLFLTVMADFAEAQSGLRHLLFNGYRYRKKKVNLHSINWAWPRRGADLSENLNEYYDWENDHERSTQMINIL